MERIEKAYIYTRVSTEMLVDGFSLVAQKADITKYAEAIGIQIVSSSGLFADLIKLQKKQLLCFASNSFTTKFALSA